MSEQSRVMAGAMVGALMGAVGAYLFLTERGRDLREQLEPALDDMKRELSRFQETIEMVGVMAIDGVGVVHEFKAARSKAKFAGGRTSY